jgi:hypothetical protein
MRQRDLFWMGHSKSLWKSTVVKSLRMGWPAGLREAEKHLTPAVMTSLLMCGLFEDVFPCPVELEVCVEEIRRRDYESLCNRETLHGRGYAPALCALKEESLAAAENERAGLWAKAREYGLSLPPRALNVWFTWLKIQPEIPGQRSIDATRWTTMPCAMADSHTPEGRAMHVRMTVLSGHYENHFKLGERVMREGWNSVRSEVHAETLAYEISPQRY